jgi:predicted nucleotidyltransferase
VRALCLRALYLFGSTARDEAGPDSDIDLFIDPDYARLGFVELFRLETRLSEALGRRVDLSTRKALHPTIRPEIEGNVIEVFG